MLPVTRKRAVLAAAGVAVVVATFAYVLPTIADYRDVWDVVRRLSPARAAVLAGAVVVNVVTYAPPWQAALPGLSFRRALVVTQASTALGLVVPGGLAAGMAAAWAMLRGWGFGRAEITRAIALVGIWNQLLNLSFPILAVAALTASGDEATLLATAAFVGVGVFAVVVTAVAAVLASGRLAVEVGELVARLASWTLGKLGRRPVAWGGPTFARFRESAGDLIRRRWHVLTAASLAGSLTVFVVLLTSLRALDVNSGEVSVVEAFAAWSLVRLLSTVPITPGGLGVVELGLTGALVAFGGDNAEIVAAVLVYRFLTVVPTLTLGLLAALTWRRHRAEPSLEPAPSRTAR